MNRWFIESSMKLRYLVIVLGAVLMVFGISQLRDMPVDIYPEFDPPYVEVQTEALGLSAEEVEALITVPMEADLLNGVAWLDQLYSESVSGLSSILLVFEPGTDPIKARQMVQERLTQAHALPNVSKPPVMLQPLSSSSRAMLVGLTSEDLSLIEMGVLARWNIKPRLMGVPGVANVAVWGQRERQLQVQVDPEELSANDVTLDQVIETTGEALWVSPLSFLESSTPGTAGWIDTPNQRLGLRHLLPISTADDLAQVVVNDADGLLLGDVATVVEDHQPLIGDAILQDGNGVLLVIEKFPGANTLQVTQSVEEALDALAPGLSGIEIDTHIFRPATYIEQATNNIGQLLLIGAVLLLITLALFYLNWRTTLVSIIVIPMSLVFATWVLYLFGSTFNAMILAGLVIALLVIVDDGIIDVENVARRMRSRSEPDSEDSIFAIVRDGALEMRNPIGYATLIILLTVMPILFFEGLAGSFLQPLVQSYVAAVLVSLLVALIFTPALNLILLAGLPAGRSEPAVARAVQRGYSWLLAPAVRIWVAGVIVALLLIIVGVALLPTMNVKLLPEFNQTDLLIRWDAAPGTSNTEMNRITAQVNEELRSVDGVDNVGSHVGRAETGDEIVGINSGEIWVSLDPAAEYATTVAAVRTVVDGYPGLFREVSTYQPEGTEDAVTGVDNDMTVRIYGYELDTLREQADSVTEVLAGISGVVDVQADLLPDEPQVEIEVDLAAAEAHGIKPGEVRRQATTLISGIHVGNLFEEQKVFDVVVWGVPEIRHNLTNIENLMIDTPSGEQVALSEVADVRIAPAATVVRRDAVSRYIDVNANLTGGVSAASVAPTIKQALQGMDIPFEYHTEVIYQGEEQQEVLWRILAVVAMVLIGVYLLLQAAFSSWSLAFFVLLTLPMALVGGVFGALLDGGIITLGSLFGFLALLGIAVRNSVVLVSNMHELEDHEGEAFGYDTVMRGARERVSPILMTALAAGLALTPMLFAGNIAGNEMTRPIAVVILGGLVTSTLLNLFVVPALYLRFGARPVPAPSTAEIAEEAQLEPA